MNKIFSNIYCGDCLEVLRNINDDSIDLIVTSPPYADRRKNTYGGIKPEKYVEWFLPRTEQLLRILNPSFLKNYLNGLSNCLQINILKNKLKEQFNEEIIDVK